MNETHASPGRSLALAAALCVLLFTAFFIASAIQPVSAHAATQVNSGTRFSGTYIGLGWDDKATITYSGKIEKVSGKSGGVKRVEYVYKKADNDEHKGNFVVVRKSKAATYDGRTVNMKLVIDYVNFNKVKAGRVNKDGGVVVAVQRANDFYIGSWNSDMNYGFKSDKGSRYNICGHVYFYWADKGDGWSKIADRPFIQCVKDIDQKNEGESWVGNSNYAEFFTFKNKTQLTQSGNTFTSKKDWDANAKKDAECLEQAGLYATTSGGDFWFTCKGGNCNTAISLGAQVTTDPPTKYVKGNVGEIDTGGELTWCISRRMPTFYKDTFSNYTLTRFYDKLDSKLEFVQSKSRVYLGSKDVTNQGDFACSNNVVTWTAGSNFLSNRSNYQGQEIKLELVTKAVKPGSLTNTANVTFFEPRWTTTPPISINATVSYYRDDETTPIYVDKVSNDNELNSAYQVKSAATTAATRENCAGLTDWYLDRECTKKYDPSKNGVVLASYAKDSNGNIILNLFAKNKVTLSYGITTDSYMKTHPNKSIFTDSLTTSKVTDYSKVLPTPKTYYYGDVVEFKKCSDLWYRHAGAGHLLSCSDGIYAYEDGSGDLLTQVRLTCNSTAYYKWKGGTYDGVLTTS